jgi:uncharacterized protein involved in type VI secretion and phage assembly
MPVVTPTILSGGKPMDPAYQVVSIDVWTEVDRVPRAELRVLDGDAAERRFAISDTAFFVPGADVEIKLRYEGEPDQSVFAGVVVRHGVEASNQGSVLSLGLKDASVKLTGVRQSAVFRDKTDDEIIKGLLEAAGVAAGSIERTGHKHREMVQYRCTPWDFILSRADALGLLVTADHGRVSLRKLSLAAPPKHHFEWGISEIYDFEIDADADNPYGVVESFSWDPRRLAPTPPSKGKGAPATPGNLDAAKLAAAVGRGVATLSHMVPIAEAERQAWADATLGRSRLSLLRGRLSVRGFADIRPLDVMEVSGIGKRFDGKTAVTGVHHRVDTSGAWQTDVQFGLRPEPFSSSPHILETPASGLVPGVTSLQIGVVAAFENDPENELRVKVALAGVDATKTGAVWARLASPDAGPKRGYFFRPEPGDEVIVGFLDDDPRYPVILGSLYGSKNTPAPGLTPPTEKNVTKGIVTRGGSTLTFVDGDKASLYIQTPQKNTLRLDDAAEAVVLSDQHGNSITMSKDGISLKSVKGFTIDAAGDVVIKGSKVDIQ